MAKRTGGGCVRGGWRLRLRLRLGLGLERSQLLVRIILIVILAVFVRLLGRLLLGLDLLLQLPLHTVHRLRPQAHRVLNVPHRAGGAREPLRLAVIAPDVLVARVGVRQEACVTN